LQHKNQQVPRICEGPRRTNRLDLLSCSRGTW